VGAITFGKLNYLFLKSLKATIARSQIHRLFVYLLSSSSSWNLDRLRPQQSWRTGWTYPFLRNSGRSKYFSNSNPFTSQANLDFEFWSIKNGVIHPAPLFPSIKLFQNINNIISDGGDCSKARNYNSSLIMIQLFMALILLWLSLDCVKIFFISKPWKLKRCQHIWNDHQRFWSWTTLKSKYFLILPSSKISETQSSIFFLNSLQSSCHFSSSVFKSVASDPTGTHYLQTWSWNK